MRLSVGGAGIPIILTIDDPAFGNLKVLPGYACNVRLELSGLSNALITVPLSSIYLNTDTGEKSVWKVNPADTTVALVPVTTGELSGDSDIVVLSGLAVGDRIVTAGVTMLHEGERVKVNDELEINN